MWLMVLIWRVYTACLCWIIHKKFYRNDVEYKRNWSPQVVRHKILSPVCDTFAPAAAPGIKKPSKWRQIVNMRCRIHITRLLTTRVDKIKQVNKWPMVSTDLPICAVVSHLYCCNVGDMAYLRQNIRPVSARTNRSSRWTRTKNRSAATSPSC